MAVDCGFTQSLPVQTILQLGIFSYIACVILDKILNICIYLATFHGWLYIIVLAQFCSFILSICPANSLQNGMYLVRYSCPDSTTDGAIDDDENRLMVALVVAAIPMTLKLKLKAILHCKQIYHTNDATPNAHNRIGDVDTKKQKDPKVVEIQPWKLASIKQSPFFLFWFAWFFYSFIYWL